MGGQDPITAMRKALPIQVSHAVFWRLACVGVRWFRQFFRRIFIYASIWLVFFLAINVRKGFKNFVTENILFRDNPN